jgi:opacity protein-like surface antigen
MKKFLMTTTLLALVTSPAVAADNTVTAEYRTGFGPSAHSSEYVLDYQAPFFQVFPNLNYGVEVATKDGIDDTNSTVAGRVGLSAPMPFQVKLNGNVQLGKQFGESELRGNYNFYGIQANLSRDLLGGFTGDFGYRYRNGFSTVGNTQEGRMNIGVSHEILPSWNAGVEYFRYSTEFSPVQKLPREEQFAFRISHSF